MSRKQDYKSLAPKSGVQDQSHLPDTTAEGLVRLTQAVGQEKSPSGSVGSWRPWKTHT